SGCPTWPAEFAAFYREKGCWRGETFGEMLRDRALKLGDRIAITCGERNISYVELDRKADQLAAGFQRLGIQQADRVIVQLLNKSEFFEVIFALFRIGALPVFSLPSHRKSEIKYFCEFAEAKAYIVSDYFAGFHYQPMAKEIQQEVPTLKHVIVSGKSEELLSLNDLYDEPKYTRPDVKPDHIAFLQLSGGSTGLPKLIPRTHDDYIYS